MVFKTRGREIYRNYLVFLFTIFVIRAVFRFPALRKRTRAYCTEFAPTSTSVVFVTKQYAAPGLISRRTAI